MSLPVPRGRQPYVIFLPGAGHQVVLGTAGTGKTTMAMLRAAHLSAATTPNSGPTLLVTYNNALVTYLRYLQPGGAHNIVVETYGRFARGYLHSLGQMPGWGGIAAPQERRSWVQSGVSRVASGYAPHAFFRRDIGFFLDELAWISDMGVTSLDEYKRIKRVGRATGLGDGYREIVWKIRDEYQTLRQAAGPQYDWYDIASAVRKNLQSDARPRRYRHIVIDEGQDFSPEAVRSLVAAADPNGSVTFFGDYHQQIYGQGLSWRACGFNVQSVERFADNYRNTAEIAKLAIALSQMPHMAGDIEDLVIPKQPTAAGALPTLVQCQHEGQELEIVRTQAKDYARTGTVAVLARTWADARRACRGLSVRKLHPDLRHWDATPGIYCGAYHSAKGLEFDAVIMPFCGETHIPLADVRAAFGDEEAAAREARLLYVGLTRARTDLLLTYSGTITSLLPPEDGLYQKVIP